MADRLRDEPGVAQPVPVAPGVQAAQKLKAAGFNDAEVSQWAQGQNAKLQAGGFKPSEIDDYWGTGDPKSQALFDFGQRNAANASAQNPTVASDPLQSFAAGWGMSVTGLVVNRKAPDTVMPEHAGLLNSIASGAGMLAGDIPAAVGGFIGGAAAGAAVPGLGETGLSEVVGGGAGAAAVPEAARQTLLGAYAAHDGKVRTWQDALQLVTHGVINTVKAGVTGAVAGGAGGVVGGKLLEAGVAPVVANTANAGAQVVAATTTGAAMDGHMPDAQDFVAGAALAIGMHAGGKVLDMKSQARVQANMEEIYKRTGTPPWEQAEKAAQDPNFRDELFTQDVNGDPVMRNFREAAGSDPEPFDRHGSQDYVKNPVTGAWEPPQDQNPRGRTSGQESTQAKPAPSGSEPASPAKALPAPQTLYVDDVPSGLTILRRLEGSADDAISPAGAIGRYQIMPGTARQYMGKDFDIRTLKDPAVSEKVASIITADLFKRYNGNMNAMAVAYNAGPGRAGEYLAKGEGTRLIAEPDPTLRGGIRYTTAPAMRDESFLPMETQKYLANLRRHFGEGGTPETLQDRTTPVPSYDEAAETEGGGGGGQPPGLPNKVGGEDEEPRGGKNFWSKANEESLTEEMLRNIGEQPTPPSGLNPDRWMSQFVSELDPARRIDNRLMASGEYDRNSQIGTEDMFRQTYASDARASAFVHYGVVDAATLSVKPNSPSLKAAIDAVKANKGNVDGWQAYMLAKRTVDKAAQGVKTGFNPNAAEALATNKSAQAKYQKATELFTGTMNGALDYAKDSGLFSDAQVAAMKRNNPTYVSMRRIMGDDAAFNAPGGRTFKAKNPLNKMEGSNRQIIDPITASIDNMRLLIKNADRNRAIGHIVGMVERGELENAGILKVEDQQAVKGADEKLFKSYGIPAEDASAYAPLAALKEQGKSGPNDFTFFRDGKAETWRATDPMLADLLRKADTPGEMNIAVKAMSKFAELKRAGITLTPDFPLRNVLRDQIAAFVLDPVHPAPFVTWMSGIMHVIKQDDVFQDALAKGAFGSAAQEIDINYLQRDITTVMDQTNTWERAANVLKHPVELAKIVHERLDQASRVGYFKAAQGKDIEPIKAATMSRKAYLDFAEKGTASVADTMSKWTAFFRPTMLGLKQVAEAVAERPASTAAYATAAITVPMTLLYILNYYADKGQPDGERYSDLPRWQRDNYFITPSIAGVRFRMSYPREVGAFFGSLVERMLDYSVQKDSHAFEGWAQNFISSFMPSLLPDAVSTPVEAMSNHNFNTGRPLIPASMEKSSGYMQYTPATSEVGKALARALGPAGMNVADLSPIQFDHFVSGWTGTMGTEAIHALDLPLGHVGKPWDVADTPFVGSFLVRNPQMSAQPIQDFYDAMNTLETKQGDFRLAMKRAEGGNPNEQDIQISAAGNAYAQAIGPIKQAISTQAAVIQGINDNPKMTPDEKRQATDQMYPQLVNTAKMGLKAIDELKQSERQDQKQPDVQALDTPPATPKAAPTPPPPGANAGQVPVS